MDGVGARQRLHHKGVADFVVGDDLFFVLGDAAALPLRSGDDSRDRFLELDHADHLLVGASGEDGRFIDEVGQVGAAEARRLPRQHVEVDGRVEGLVPRVDVEDLAAALDVGPVEGDVAVESSRSQKRRVEDVRPVGGSDHDHVGVGVESVHLDQELVQRLLALVVATAQPGASLAADGVDLVHEDDAGRVLLGLVEEVADAACADTDEHLDELRA